MRREFSRATKKAAWERCHREYYHGPADIINKMPTCEAPGCGAPFFEERPEYHHIIPAAFGGMGDNRLDNCLVVHKRCHKRLTADVTIPQTSKANRILEKRAGLRRPKQKIQSRGFAR